MCENILLIRTRNQLAGGEEIIYVNKCYFGFLYITSLAVAYAWSQILPPYLMGQYTLGVKGAFITLCIWYTLFITLYYMSNLQVITNKKIYSLTVYNFFANHDKKNFFIISMKEIKNIALKSINAIRLTGFDKTTKYLNTTSNQETVYKILKKILLENNKEIDNE